jgi:hypothetical protein
MSTTATASSLSLRSLSPATTAGASGTVASGTQQAESARSLAVMLLAAVVAAMVVLADRLINTWADGHLLLAWVFLWVVVFAGMALFAGTARTIAARTLVSLDGWSQAVAEARADARLWKIALSDPRLMQELELAVSRNSVEAESASTSVAAAPAEDFSDALAPLGMSDDTATTGKSASGWGGFFDRLAQQRSRNMHLYYV